MQGPLAKALHLGHMIHDHKKFAGFLTPQTLQQPEIDTELEVQGLCSEALHLGA